MKLLQIFFSVKNNYDRGDAAGATTAAPRGITWALLKKLGCGLSGETVVGATGSTSGCVSDGLTVWGVPAAESYSWGTTVARLGDRSGLR